MRTDITAPKSICVVCGKTLQVGEPMFWAPGWDDTLRKYCGVACIEQDKKRGAMPYYV